MYQFRLFLFLFCFISLFTNGQNSVQKGISDQSNLPAGSLVIVGGGLEHNNSSVFHRMIELSGGPETASFAVIPSASGVAVQSFVSFRIALISYGVKPENIHLIPIAAVDDDSTKLVNESTWVSNGNDEILAEKVRNCSCIWFTGGDQLRTTKTLYKSDGSRTPVLEAAWEVFLKGGVIGGTSAGAAIMSDPMIGAGNSMGALENGVITDAANPDDFDDNTGVLLVRGLGFFPLGMVDQHFEARGRLGRLIRVMLHEKENLSLGFGVDENTALIYNGKLKILEVAGVSGVTFVNTSEIKTSKKEPLLIENIQISYLTEGDQFEIQTGKIIPSGNKTNIKGHEKLNEMIPMQTSLFSDSEPGFKDIVASKLMENKGTDKVENICFMKNKRTLLFRLSKTAQSEGYCTDNQSGSILYTIKNIRMDMIPVKFHLSKLH
ncbi:MAG: cyanophycinase [Bacteroidales bacterium]|jgi:cyanophycinase